MNNEEKKTLGVILGLGSVALAALALFRNEPVTERPAINDMGDLDNDGYVSQADIDIVKAFYFGYRIPDISPLTVWEFVRRADLNHDANIDTGEVTAMKTFIEHGTFPDPVIVGRASPDGMGDLNDDGIVDGIDIVLFNLLAGSIYTSAEVSPLDEAELMRRADINEDGKIDSLDITAIINFINTGNWPEPGPEQGFLYGQVFFESFLIEGIAWVRSGEMLFIHNGTVVQHYFISTDTAGTFRIKVAAGTYDICIKFPRALSQRVNNVTIAPGFVPTNVDFPTLIEGDANNDDIIDVLDMILIGQSMGLQDGDPGFNDDCDFNRDGVVDQSDMDIEAAHSGQVGDCHGIG